MKCRPCGVTIAESAPTLRAVDDLKVMSSYCMLDLEKGVTLCMKNKQRHTSWNWEHLMNQNIGFPHVFAMSKTYAHSANFLLLANLGMNSQKGARCSREV